VSVAEPRTGTDLELLRRLQAGENEAWASVAREYTPRLLAYLRQNLPSAEDAEDVLSETFSASVRAVGNFDGRAALSTFLYAIAYRKIADFWRKHSHIKSVDIESPTVVVVAHGPTTQERLEFEDAMETLPEISRQVLLLRYQIGLGVDEIAEVLERSYKGTESLLSRARGQLREAMREGPHA
jgi:RNA polymerase sigma-70 factor (ECF subfamily)